MCIAIIEKEKKITVDTMDHMNTGYCLIALAFRLGLSAGPCPVQQTGAEQANR